MTTSECPGGFTLISCVETTSGGGVTSLNGETGDVILVAGTNITITPSGQNITIDAAGGGGTPGGSNTQVQYNDSGSFGGITGATTDGATLTLVAPVLGTPASATLTNCAGLPTAGLVNNAVTYAKMQQASTVTLLGNPTGSTANVEEITLGTNLSFSGTVLNASGGSGSIPQSIINTFG